MLGKSRAKSTLFLSVGKWWINLCGGSWVVPSGQELMKNGWCRHIFRESNKASDIHANRVMDNGDSGLGAQWTAFDLHDKIQKSRQIVLSVDGPDGEVDLVRLRGFCGYGMNMVSLRRSPMLVACKKCLSNSSELV